MVRMHTLSFVVRYLRPQWPTVALLAALLVCSVGIQVGNPEILRSFIDSATSGRSLSSLWIMAALFLGMGLLNQGLTVVSAYVSSNLAWQTTNQMRLDLTSHCIHLDLSFHAAHAAGELIERTDEDVSSLSNLFSLFTLQIIMSLLVLICVLAVLFHEEWRLGLAMSIYASLCLFVIQSTRNTTSLAWKKASQAKANLHGFIGEYGSGVADLRTSGAIAYSMRLFYDLRRMAFLKDWSARRFSLWLSCGTDLLLIGGSVGAFLLAAALFQMGTITLGVVYLVVTYTQLLSTPLQTIMEQIDDLRQARASLERIQELFAIPPTIGDGLEHDLPGGALSVQFTDVSFAYHPDVPTLQQITLDIKPGEILGLLGQTGSGKTTLARLLFRLYEVDSGTICVGGRPIQTLQLAALRQRIGMVTQDVQLFHASVRDNLTFFETAIPDEQIVHVLSEVGLADWYEALPHGLDTVVTTTTSTGIGLSAGEAQLLAFARVFLQNPSIVILDEASSRLDPATELFLDTAIKNLFVGRTGIIIAHRLATINRADKIAILRQGQMVEYDRRENLLQDPTSQLNGLLQTGRQEQE
ncbi:ABC transporter ATP-binding protein [Tengunoibacter tsumagoiensis]|uniref:Helicase n=1 Tax=Tengunoibacter tsumagoiensis TaxID=2014871 RepID=A0A402A952_9CHLR|nr:ABC transporter ATP-binding protein [Tengunoibacter tsumagoiensis]GCE15673.1 helicase [Tengunoibacter tsumagoiensis]